MGIDRFEDSDEDPVRNADVAPRHETGRSAEAGPSGDDPQSGDAPRPGDPAPDHSPHESPETADTAPKRAEPRTRNEYADYVRPTESPPIDGDSLKRNTEGPNRQEDEHDEALPSDHGHTEEWHSTEEFDEPNDVKAEPRLEEKLDADQEREADDRGEPPAVDDLDGPAPDASSNQGTDQGTGPEEDLAPSPGPNGESPDEGPVALEASDQETSDVDERTRPLTDGEWAEHLDEVRDGLDTAREAGLRTTQLHTIDRKGQIWSEERDLLHESILEDFYAKAADVPCDFKAIMAGGLGGAGKTTVLTGQAGIDLTQYLMINPDDFKEEMAHRGMLPEIEGLSPMEASDLAHEESSYLALQLALRAQAEGKNIIWDITMSTEKSTEKRINDLRTAEYTHIEGLFVDIPIEASVRRTESRHRQGYEMYRTGEGLGGRYVPPEVIKSQGDSEWGSQNRRTFETMKERFDEWSTYDNSIDGRPATLIDSSRTRHAG